VVASKSMSMRWCRIRRKPIAGLGLFALLLQLVVSFGHVHSRDLGVSPTLGSELAISKATPASGQHQVPNGLPDDDCPICSTMHVAASGLLPAMPVVVDPTIGFQVLQISLADQFNPGIARHTLFQTRAPPIA
jgi:hypothetical protein